MGLNASVFNFQVALSEANVAKPIEPPGNVPGSENPQARTVAIKAMAGNTNVVFIGGPEVTALSGFELEKGETVSLDLQSTGGLFFVGAHVGDKLCVIGVGP